MANQSGISPVLAFVLGVIVALLAIANQTSRRRGWQPWRRLGESSLFIYTLHCFIIGWILLPLLHGLTGLQLTGVYALLILILVACGWGIRGFKQVQLPLPRWVMWGIGT